jgi:hypothetical protein
MNAKVSFLALIVVAAASACSGSALSPCPLPAQPAFYMIAPSPGATGVPDSLSAIYFGGFGPDRVTLSGGTQTIALTLEPVPTPTPTPQGALPESVALLSTTLLPSTAYSLTYNWTISGQNCASQSGTATVGTFTTQ